MQLLQTLLVLAATILYLTCSVQAQSAPTCLDENGNAVDWYVWVKAPETSSSFTPVDKGFGYIYGDANSYGEANFWTNSSHSVGDGNGAIDRTLNQIYSNQADSSMGYAFYNDETPAGITSYSYGHSKGILGWTGSGGFWLIHSVPKMGDDPSKGGNFAYPNSGRTYGQTAICISLDATNLDAAFGQFDITNPQIYAKQWIAGTESTFPNGNAFFNGNAVNTKSATLTTKITTAGGKTFTHFAKNSAWGQCIFGNLIGPAYQVTTLVESWQDPYETPYLPPTVTDPVYSVQVVAMPVYAQWDSISWKQPTDHAKWCVSTADNGAAALVCIGDINKQKSQNSRSGGMLCIQDKNLYAAYTALIASTDMN